MDERRNDEPGIAAGQTQPSGLAAAQAAFVAAITGTGPVPPGFDVRRVDTARRALLTKRCGEIAGAWPAVASSLGEQLAPLFHRWAATRPTQGAAYDGHSFARAHWSRLDREARLEVADAEATHRYSGGRVIARRGIAVRLAAGRMLIGVAGRRVL